MLETLERIQLISRRFPRQAIEFCCRIESAAVAAGNLPVQLDALYLRYVICERLGEAVELLDSLRAGLQLAEAQSLAPQAGHLYEALGRIHYTRTELRDALNYWKRCIDISLLTGDIASGIEGRIGLSNINNDVGNPADGSRYFKDAENLINHIDNPYLASKLALNMGVNHYYRKELEPALAQFKRGLYFAEQGKVHEYVAEANWHIGHMYFELGQFDEAKAFTEKGLALAEKSRYVWLRGVAYDTLAQILLAQGRREEAFELCEKALHFSREINSLWQQALYLGNLSQLAEQMGDVARALSFVREQVNIKAKMDQLLANEKVQQMRDYDLLERPMNEQLLELAADPELNRESHSQLQQIIERAAGILKLDWIGVWLLNEHEQQYYCYLQHPTELLKSGLITETSTPDYFNFVQQLKMPVVATDTRLHPAAKDLQLLFGGSMPMSTLDFPLQLQNRHIGFVCFAQQERINEWSREFVSYCSRILQLIERDFANRRNAEIQAELQRNDKMAALGKLVAGISHEINTPIGIGVTACSSLHAELRQLRIQLNEGKLGKQTLFRFMDMAEEGLDVTERNLQRAALLINSFKEIAVDQSSESQRKINVERYLGEIMLSLSPILKRSPYLCELQCEQGLEMYTYPGALAQIITNFINNSILHGFEHAERGLMKISIRSDQDGGIFLDYSDDGCGMDEKVKRYIFDPFFTTKLGQGGSGLGMSIVYNLITQRLHGSIELESSPGQGVHFHCHLPKLA